MDAIRVLIVDDEALVRHALRIFVESDAKTTVAGEAIDGISAVEQCVALIPDVVLMDIQIPGMNGIEATEEILNRLACVKVIAVTTFSSEKQVVSALRAGAAGYLVKDTTPESIVQSIIDVHEGRAAISPQVAGELVAAVRQTQDSADISGETRGQNLTDREKSIVQLLAQGMSNGEIAEELYLSEAAVKANFGRIMSKWGVRDRVQVLIHAARKNMVTL